MVVIERGDRVLVLSKVVSFQLKRVSSISVIPQGFALQVPRKGVPVPLAFNSSVQRLTNSVISSGSTVVLVYASSQRGFEGRLGRSGMPAFFLDLDFPWPSLPLIREKRLGIATVKGQ